MVGISAFLEKGVIKCRICATFLFIRSNIRALYRRRNLCVLPGRHQAFLAFATRGKSERELFAEENTRLALCAVADEMAKEERVGAIRSEKAGQYSVTYQSDMQQADFYRAAALYLKDGALFRGCGPC